MYVVVDAIRIYDIMANWCREFQGGIAPSILFFYHFLIFQACSHSKSGTFYIVKGWFTNTRNIISFLFGVSFKLFSN